MPPCVRQSFTIGAATTFSLNWFDAGRPQGGANDGDQLYSVTLFDGTNTQTLFSGGTSSFQPFGAMSFGPFVLGPGTYSLSFNGLTTVGDHTAFIDVVSLDAAVPETATWLMLILGFGAIGGALRRRRNTGYAFG